MQIAIWGELEDQRTFLKTCTGLLQRHSKNVTRSLSGLQGVLRRFPEVADDFSRVPGGFRSVPELAWAFQRALIRPRKPLKLFSKNPKNPPQGKPTRKAM